MKVILSKKMRMIAMIVLGIIVITYMFFNSIKEGAVNLASVGSSGEEEEETTAAKDGSAVETGDVWKGLADCEAVEKADWDKVVAEMQCFTAEGDDGEGSWGECSDKVAEHTKQLKAADVMGNRWIKDWCVNQKGKNDLKNAFGTKLSNWMSEKFNKWRTDEIKSIKDNQHKYFFAGTAGDGEGTAAPQVAAGSANIKQIFWSLEFPNEERIFKRKKE